MLYALPSLALFIVLIPYTGLTDTTVIIPLTAVLAVRAAARAWWTGSARCRSRSGRPRRRWASARLRRLVQVELPLAVPIVIAGLRVAVVSSISLASVGQLIGVSSLGYLFIDGYQRDFPEEIYVGGGLIIALALICDLLLVLLRRVLTPWRPRRARRQAEPLPIGVPARPLPGGAA